MKKSIPTPPAFEHPMFPHLTAKPRRFFGLYMFWLRVKNFFPELYYALRQHYFVERMVFSEDEIDGNKVRTIESSEYLAVKNGGKKFEFTIYPRHATIFTFIVGAIYVYLLNKQKNKPANIGYSMVSVGDVAFIHEIHSGEKLFQNNGHPNSVLAVSPVVLMALCLILAGVITLLSYYMQY